MSRCGCQKPDPKQEKHCVKKTLAAILEAQHKARRKDDCDHSCQDSINCLLGKKRKSDKNTIPFILYCQCEPFKATGVTTSPCHTKTKKFHCITSYIFKINGLNDDCAVLELLTFKPSQPPSQAKKKCSHHKDSHSPCSQLHRKEVDHLRRTGVCINVDLSIFSGVTCLPPVKLSSC